jgi:hypothetical protein
VRTIGIEPGALRRAYARCGPIAQADVRNTYFASELTLGGVERKRILGIHTVGAEQYDAKAITLRRIRQRPMRRMRGRAIETQLRHLFVATQAAAPLLQHQSAVMPSRQLALDETARAMLIDTLTATSDHLDFDPSTTHRGRDRGQMRRQIVAIAQAVADQQHALETLCRRQDARLARGLRV